MSAIALFIIAHIFPKIVGVVILFVIFWDGVLDTIFIPFLSSLMGNINVKQ